MIRHSIETLQFLAGPGGVPGTGAGLASFTSWGIAAVVVLLLVAVGWWSRTRARRK